MAKQRRIILTITVLYTLFILFFMFFAFGRGESNDHSLGYTFIFMPDNFITLPSLAELLHPSLMSMVGFGNTIAFIPFGILIPWLYRVSFVRFITLFFIAILVLETIQALTFLGSFDINDALQNTIGAALGFGAYKLGFRSRSLGRNLVTTAISGLVLLIALWGLGAALEKITTKVEGPFVAIHEWTDSSGNSSAGDKPDSIQIIGQKVPLRYNLYGAEGGDSRTFTYKSEGQTIFSFYYGSPEPTDYSGSISMTLDGREILTGSGEDQRSNPEVFPSLFWIPLEPGNELKITIKGELKIWDVGYKRMQYFWN
ncbi:teicoplanin resistance protein VanZ [Paenibacillus sp. IHB B 3415]|uniref:VanZ family protein n=1 Tax=Paenibacillus sp. IHB B 3415 TaxID=867080 RepID=UPI000575DAFD|nr:VanZ family protein [Paenibacillus sp. IHB B 3415]KHL93451.1 teicoplanin resistance protein VanZ [Paenibacillus sp. IHB B 3415]